MRVLRRSILPRYWIFLFLLAVPALVTAGGFRSIENEIKSVYLNPFRKLKLTEEKATEDWAWIRDDFNPDPRAKDFTVPYETGRGVLTPFHYTPGYELFLKGTGANPEYVGEKNKIRYSTPTHPIGLESFDGKFKTREAYFDIYNSHYLEKIGVKVALPVGVLTLGDDPSLAAERGIYARELIIQTRLSNLHQIKSEKARNEIETAIKKLIQRKDLNEGATLLEYYFYMVRTMAKSAALMQSAGFQHGYLHHQQFTLAGELTDVGTGTWAHDPDFNPFSRQSAYPYFKFERQPALVQNMLLRTHSVSGKSLNELGADSETFKLQKGSLLGVIDRIDPKIGEEIRTLDPERVFWKEFEYRYQHLNRQDFVSKIKPSNDFEWVNQNGKMTQIPKTVHDKTPLPPENQYNYWRVYDGSHPFKANYETTAIINEKRLTTLGGPNPRAIQKFFPPGSKSGIAKNHWGLLIEPDDYTKKFFSETKEHILKIEEKYGSLLSPEASLDLLHYISRFVRLRYGPKLTEKRETKNYENFIKTRYTEGTSLGEIIKMGAGECHDTALLAYLYIQQIREVEPKYDARIVKSTFGEKNNSHFYTIVRTPSDAVVIVDPIMGDEDRMSAYSDLLHKEAISNKANAMHTRLDRIYEFAEELNTCSLYLGSPKKVPWLKRFLGF